MNTVLRERADPLYVINLSASGTPVALSHPDHPALRRYTFFVSRRREEGRERFRLHMGYFHEPTHAEELLPLIREVYPTAWVGPAPEGPWPGANRPGPAEARAEARAEVVAQLTAMRAVLTSLGDPQDAAPAVDEAAVLNLLEQGRLDIQPPILDSRPPPKAHVLELFEDPASTTVPVAAADLPPRVPTLAPAVDAVPAPVSARKDSRRVLPQPRRPQVVAAKSADPGRRAPSASLLQQLGAGDLSLDSSGPAINGVSDGRRRGVDLEAGQQGARFGRLLGLLSGRLGGSR
jgi:hypothetical protein